MCGIYGILQLDGSRADAALMPAMGRVTAHRGPDDEGLHAIVGRSPPPALVEGARARRLNWEFTGFVDDVWPFVHNAHVYAIPLRVGGCTRIKAYEAMATGCPVVSTRIGVEGLPVEPDRHFLEADSAETMAAAILSLLDDDARRNQLAQKARRLVGWCSATLSG